MAEAFCNVASINPAFRGQASRFIAYSPWMRAPKLLSREDATILSLCAEVLPLEGHLRNVRRQDSFRAKPPGSVRRALRRLVAAGALVPWRAFVDACRRANGAGGGARIASVCVTTRGRLKTVERGLRSYIEADRRFGRDLSYVVADDTLASAERGAYREMLGRLAGRYGPRILYAGLEEKTRYARVLAQRCGVDPKVVRFALFGGGEFRDISYGANRNWILLQAAGEAVFCADDDTLCRAGRVPGFRGGLKVSPTVELGRWFFRDRAEALDAVPEVDEDVLRVQEDFLGRLPRECFGRLAEASPEGLRLPGSVLAGVFMGTGRVVATFPAVLGDAAVEHPGWVLLCGEASRRRLLQSEDRYRVATSSRESLVGSPQASLVANTYFPAMFFGLDNRDLLPPFFPVGRGEDTLFGRSLQVVRPRDRYLTLPWCLLHAPDKRRVWAVSDIRRHTSRIRLADLLAAMTALPASLAGETPERTLASLGRNFQKRAGLRGRDFEISMDTLYGQILTGQLAILREVYDRYKGKPDFWAEDILQWMDILRGPLGRSGLGRMVEFEAIRDPGRARERLRGILRLYGRLLEAWPAMVAAARELKEKGVQPAKVIS